LACSASAYSAKAPCNPIPQYVTLVFPVACAFAACGSKASIAPAMIAVGDPDFDN
jgi:hypothetical protein